jgi:hypothetical protein
MSLVVRIVTGLVVAGLVYIAVGSGNLLGFAVYGFVAYIWWIAGLALADKIDE